MPEKDTYSDSTIYRHPSQRHTTVISCCYVLSMSFCWRLWPEAKLHVYECFYVRIVPQQMCLWWTATYPHCCCCGLQSGEWFDAALHLTSSWAILAVFLSWFTSAIFTPHTFLKINSSMSKNCPASQSFLLVKAYWKFLFLLILFSTYSLVMSILIILMNSSLDFPLLDSCKIQAQIPYNGMVSLIEPVLRKISLDLMETVGTHMAMPTLLFILEDRF